MSRQNAAIGIIQNILKANHLPSHYLKFTADSLPVLDLGLRNSILGQKNIQKIAGRYCRNLEPGVIHFLTDRYYCTYAILRVPDSHNLFVCGPMLLEDLRENRFYRLFSSLHLPEELREPMRSYYNKLTYMPSQAMLESILLELGERLCGRPCSIRYFDTGTLNRPSADELHRAQASRHPFSSIEIAERRSFLENSLLTAVKAGDEKLALSLLEEASFCFRFLPRRLENELRDLKDYALSLNSCLCKAAEQADVHPVHIERLSNRIVPQIERVTNSRQFYELMRRGVSEYCALARDHRQITRNPVINRVLAYIDINLTGDLRPHKLALYLGIHISHLSAMFSREMGTSLISYINLRRIDYARLLLDNTDLSIADIAWQCGYMDPHYFSRLFKICTGVSPKKYRTKT